MPKQKNALRKHYIAPFDPKNPDKVPSDSAFLWIAKGIKTATNESTENVEEQAYFDGDGTPESVVTMNKHGRSFEGEYIPEDPAQAHIASLQYGVGEGRKSWYREVSSDGKTKKTQLATVTDIKIGDGTADAFESIAFKVMWDKTPIVASNATA